MKLQHVVGVISLAFCAQVAHSQSSVTINVPNPAGCTISGVTSLTSSGAGTFTATGGTAQNCGGTTQPGTNPPVVTVDQTTVSYVLGSGAPAPTFTWSATGAVSCTAGQTSSNVFNNLAFTGPFPTSASTLTQNLCNGATCGGAVTVTPTTGAVVGSNNLFVTCTADDNSQTTKGVTVSLNPPNTQGCGNEEASDLTGYTRQCDGGITYSFGAPQYSGPMTDLTQMIGTWPGSVSYLGQSAIFSLGKTSYVSFAFTPGSGHALKFSANASWGAGGIISVSTKPGKFLTSSTEVKCGQYSGASNNLIFANNGYAGASLNCRNLSTGTTYYLNIVNANTTGAALCRAAACPMSYTPLKVN